MRLMAVLFFTFFGLGGMADDSAPAADPGTPAPQLKNAGRLTPEAEAKFLKNSQSGLAGRAKKTKRPPPETEYRPAPPRKRD